MACRNMTSCEEARKEIALETQNKFVYCKHLDLASLASVRNFSSNINNSKALQSLNDL